MSPHLSDLSLERLLKGEARPPMEREHVHACDACWARWQQLHLDEGWPGPKRIVLSGSPPPTSRLPWVIAAGSSALALAALALMALRPSPGATTAEIVALQAQVDAMQVEASRVGVEHEQSSRASSASRDGEVLPGAEVRVVEGPELVESGQLERLVQERLEERLAEVQVEERAAKTKALDAAKDEALPRHSNRIAASVDRLVEVDGVAEGVAATVQDLLEDELDETWRIKEAAAAGELDEKEAWADWKSLRGDTDDALSELLEPDQVKALREDLDSGGK